MKVGPPPIRPARPRKPHDAGLGSMVIGAAMPKPSVMLCSAKPATRTPTNAIAPARVAEDVPEDEDQNPGRERVEEALYALGQPAHAGDREAEEDGDPGDGSERDGGALAHDWFIWLVRAKVAIR